jgi:glucose-1-phosphate thymidylyltransferase
VTISEAVVLAAGEGHRLRPLTVYQPKPMLPVANRPIIDYVLDALLEAGIDRVVVVVGYRQDRIQSHLLKRYGDVDLTFVEQDTRLGSGHALQQAAAHVGEAFLVLNGDNIVDADVIRAVVDRFETTDSTATVAVANSETPEEYGVVTVDRGQIADIADHDDEYEGYLVNAGVYAFDQSVFAALAATAPRDGELQLPDAVAELHGPVTSVLVDGWLDPSTPWRLLDLTESVLAHRAGPTVHDSAHVHETAVVEPTAAVGPGCDVGAGAVVRAGACLQENVHVGPNTVVERSIVSTDARLGANAVLRDSVVGVAAHVGDGAVSPGGRADVLVDGRVYPDRRIGAVVADRARVEANVTLDAGSYVGADATVRSGVVLTRSVPDRAEVSR